MIMIERYTALYSPLDIEYQQAYSGPYENLFPQGGKKDNKITGFGRPMVCFFSNEHQEYLIKSLYGTCSHIEYMDYLIDGSPSPITLFLLKRGYKATPYFTQIIDLTKSVEELHAGIRKSYKSLCNQPRGEIEIIGCDSIFDGINEFEWVNCVIEQFRKLHTEVAGRETRSKETWDTQAKMIKKGEAFLVTDTKMGILESVALFYCNKHCAYYAVAASRDRQGGHPVVWAGIKECLRRGLKFIEMGEQVFFAERNYDDRDDEIQEREKLVGISKFKRGFGGVTKLRLLLTEAVYGGAASL